MVSRKGRFTRPRLPWRSSRSFTWMVPKVEYHWSFFTVIDKGGIVLAGRLEAVLVSALGPLAEQRAAQLLNLFDDHILSLVGIHSGAHFVVETLHDSAESSGDHRIGAEWFQKPGFLFGDRGGQFFVRGRSIVHDCSP